MDRETAFNTLLEKIDAPVNCEMVSVNNIRTHYLMAGSGQPVILLHGAGAGGIVWSSVIGSLSQKNRVIAPDMAGYGDSDKPRAAYDRPFYDTWLNAFVETLGLGRVNLVGHSLGGAIALHYALMHPERVENLILVGSAGLGRGIPLGALIGMFWVNTWPSRIAAWLASQYVLHDPASIDQALIEYRLEVVRMPGSRYMFWHGKGRAAAPFTPDQLSRVAQPTLIIWGEEDRFFSIEHARAACGAIPDARLCIIPDAGHCPYIAKPDEFSTIVSQFIR